MNIEVRYVSRGGNTKKLAEAIAQALGVEARAVPAPLPEKVDLLFLGGSVYGGGVDDALKAYIEALPPGQVSRVAVFSTAAIKKSAYPQIAKLLAAKGIPVSERDFHCPGQFTVLHRGRPNAEDLKRAEAFARQTAQEGDRA